MYDEYLDSVVRNEVCKHPDGLSSWIECNPGLFAVILICIFCFFIGVVLLTNNKSND